MSEDKVKNYLYAVICFTKTHKKQKSQIDLVPSSWVMKIDEKNIFCKYPPKADYHQIPEWLSLLKDPEDNWNLFPITIISYARNLEQGNRRLDRAYVKSTDIKSTDDEDAECHKLQPRSMAEIKRGTKPLLSTISEIDDHETIRDEWTQKKNENHNSEAIETTKSTVSSRNTSDQFDEKLKILSDDIQQFHPGLVLLRDYIDARCSKMTQELRAQFISVKRSLQYDLKEKNNELKHTLIVNTNTLTPRMSLSDAKKALGVSFPLTSIEDFLKYEDSLKNSEEKRNALRDLYRILIYGEAEVTGCIKKLMVATVEKPIELEYSGKGKGKGKGKPNQNSATTKRDFSATQTFICLQDVIMEKFGDTKEIKLLAGKVGRWLSGAPDRCGGRKQR